MCNIQVRKIFPSLVFRVSNPKDLTETVCINAAWRVKVRSCSHLIFFTTGVRHVSAIDIYTPADVEAVNGTSVKLKCTFSSSHPVSLQSVTVSWNFRPLNSGTEESVGRNCKCFQCAFYCILI